MMRLVARQWQRRLIGGLGVGVALAVTAGCGGDGREANAGGHLSLDGTYRMTVAAEQVARHDHVPVSQATPENYGDFVLVVDRGRFAFTQQNLLACTWQYGSLAVRGTVMDWRFVDGGGMAPTNAENKPGERFLWRWSLYREALTLRPISPRDLTEQTWRRVDAVPSRTALSKRCSLPHAALP